jgi:hypothetical protein
MMPPVTGSRTATSVEYVMFTRASNRGPKLRPVISTTSLPTVSALCEPTPENATITGGP